MLTKINDLLVILDTWKNALTTLNVVRHEIYYFFITIVQQNYIIHMEPFSAF